MPYINKYGRHPVTGAPLKKEDLIPLNFHKNQEGTWCAIFETHSTFIVNLNKRIAYVICSSQPRLLVFLIPHIIHMG